jgi:hypothetical protein
VPRRCTICTHPDRAAIDSALAAGAAFPAVAAEWHVSPHAVGRHVRADHVTKRVAETVAAAEVVQADDLLVRVAALEADARRIGRAAEEAGDTRTALLAIREILRIRELLGKAAGVLTSGGVAVGVNVNDTIVRVTYEQDEQERRELLTWLSVDELRELRAASTTGEQLMSRAAERRVRGERPPGYIDVRTR